MEATEAPPLSPDEAAAMAGALREQVGRAVRGQRAAIDHILVAFLAGGHVLLEGVPGVGKTLMVLSLARAIEGNFSRIQFTPDLMPSDVTGHALFDQTTNRFRIRKGPVFTNLLLADEINRAPAKTQAALLEVMAERQVTIEGDGFTLSPPFMTLATQNPVEQEGTYPLPEAQLDRFLLKVALDYPTEEVEIAIVRDIAGGSAGGRVGDALDVSAVEAVATPAQAVALQEACACVTVDDRVVAYAVRLARATRSWAGLRYGAGPRGGLAMVRAARAVALLEGRDFVTPDDIKSIAPPALRHRVALSPELELEGMHADDVLRGILDAVEAPRQ